MILKTKPKDELSDVIQWHHLIFPEIVLQKDGSLLSVIKYRGHDLDSSSRSELINKMSQINNIIKRFDSGWVINFEAQRYKSEPYPERKFPAIVHQIIDDERRKQFNSGMYFESEYFLTLNYLPPPDFSKKISDIFLTRQCDFPQNAQIYAKHIENFKQQVDSFYELLKMNFGEIKKLANGELLTYLHSCISEKPYIKIANPRICGQIPLYIDYILTDTPFIAGYESMLGNKHVKVIGIKSFPADSKPGYLDVLNRLSIEYRWCSRFICMDKTEALNELETYRKKFFGARTSLSTYINQIFSDGISSSNALENNEATQKFEDVDQNINIITDDTASQGYLTLTIVLLDEDKELLEEKAKLVTKTIDALGFVTYDETINSLEAWLGSIPGHPAYNVRKPLYNTYHLTHLLPLSAVWAGDISNKHLNGYPLIYSETDGSTPFRLNLHYGDVGHTMLLGPTGAGKSTHLGLIASQFMSYKNAQVYIFDKDASSRILTLGVEGDFYDIASEEDTLSFQPLARIDKESELIWAHEWIVSILEEEGIDGGKATAETKNEVKRALKVLASSPVEQRTITGLYINLQSRILKEALTQFTINGIYGKILDAATDNLSYGKWQVFEMGKLMEMKGVCQHVLSYLFHRIEVDRLDGSPTLIILDECWLMLQNKQFSQQMAIWLRTLRKKNASVVFATQSIADVQSSNIFPVILESCYSKIFLPNSNATEEKNKKIYDAFGLNDKEIRIISEAASKKEYYFKNPNGSRKYDLRLGPKTLFWVASSSTEDQNLAKKIIKVKGKNHFAYWMYASKGLTDYANEYKEYASKLYK